MKKIIATALMSMVSIGYAASAPTLSQLRGEYESVLAVAQTNVVAGQKFFNSSHLAAHVFAFSDREDAEYKSLTAEMDQNLYQAGLYASTYGYWHTCTSPISNLCARAFEVENLAINIPYAVSMGLKYNVACKPWKLTGTRTVKEIEEFVGLLNECINLKDGKLRDNYGYFNVQDIRKRIQELAPRKVKKYLRSQGKSIVTKDGVNPCEELITELNTALHAPYFNGLNAWLATVGVNASIDVSKLPTAAAVQQLKADILSAEKDMTPMDDFILKVCLGVDAYNQFVKDYNGES